MAAGPDDIRGLIPFTLASLVLGQSLGFVQSPVSTGLHHAMVTDTFKPPCGIAKNSEKVFGVTYHLHFTANPARLVDDAYGRFFDRHIQSGIVFHAALLL